MPRYDFRCRSCGTTFEVSRSMNESNDPATCPDGHDDTVKLLSTVAIAADAGGPAPASDSDGGGGCCGGACC